jgi:hypothetical protein
MRTHRGSHAVQEVTEHGQGVRAAVEHRQHELELRLVAIQNSEQQGSPVAEAIETALASLDTLLPKEHSDITPAIAEPLVRWLEANKNLGLTDAPKAHR